MSRRTDIREDGCIAERVRKIDGMTTCSIGHISKAKRLLENDADFVTLRDLLAKRREDKVALVSLMKETHNLCDGMAIQ